MLSDFSPAAELRKLEGSLYYRLNSIDKDSPGVKEVRSWFPNWPCYANLRCGLWYAPDFDGTCYFKSTDGISQFKITTQNVREHLFVMFQVTAGIGNSV